MIIIECDLFGDGEWGKLNSLPEINERREVPPFDRKHLDREQAIAAAEHEIARWHSVIHAAYPHIRMRVADTDARRDASGGIRVCREAA